VKLISSKNIRVFTAVMFLSATCLAYSQTETGRKSQIDHKQADPKQSKDADKGDTVSQHPNEKYLVQHLAQDQAAIWSSPFRMKARDLRWAVPFAGITTGLIMTDRTASHEATRGSYVATSKRLSDAGLAFVGASSAGLYVLGWADGDNRKRETGVLSGEAMIDGLAVDEVLKYGFRRQRPVENNGAGRFFQSGSQDSFPSAHATLAFAFASVLAHEYPGWLTKALAYGGASAVSLARVTGKQHFPSDVFVGGAFGYLIGRQVFREHHDEKLDLPNYGVFVGEATRVSLRNAGSSYVELDSWIYPAIERLVALGVIGRPFLGLRPWTRTAIAEMLAESPAYGDSTMEAQAGSLDSASSLYSVLKAEFAQELGIENEGVNESLRVESFYTRLDPIAGTPLNDSYHFGQTVINNFGRPYQQGFNAVSGFTSRAATGHFFFYARGEYQIAPSAPAYPDSVRAVIAQADINPKLPAVPIQASKQFRLLDTYAGASVLGNEISVGKQSLWWGTGEGGAMILSNNAEPIYMLRINRTAPLHIPFLSKLLGPMRYDNFFGKLSGHNFPPNPFFYGDKMSFQPTQNLEFGFSRTAVFAGQGKTPLTFGTFRHSFFSFNDVGSGFASIKGTPRDPGARHSAFDFSYRLPFLRNWVTLYADSVVHDDASPVDAPRRAAIVPGFYLSHFPRLNKLDLRVESGYTDIPTVQIPSQQGGHFLYWEAIYHDAYTNKGNLVGSWIGRQGKGTQIWSSYWLSPFSAIQVSYRNSKISPQFIPGGTTQNDFSAVVRFRLGKDVELLTNLQYEQWTVPVLAPNRKSDFLSSIEVTFWPKDWVKTKRVFEPTGSDTGF
jgi:Capsule assembly protein Wzi/PAP2 superfamily